MVNLGNMMKQAQQLQKKMAEAQNKLNDIEVEGTSGGGLIKVTATAKGIFKRLKDKFAKGKGKRDFEKQKKAIAKGADDYIRKLDKESVNEKVVKVSKKDDVPGNPMKMSGEEKIKKLAWSASQGTGKPGSYEIKGNKY